MKCRFGEKKIEEACVVGLDDEKEQFFDRDTGECWANDDLWWVCPNLPPYEI